MSFVLGTEGLSAGGGALEPLLLLKEQKPGREVGVFRKATGMDQLPAETPAAPSKGISFH